jgi:PEP-CTERM motif-containing protein
MSVCKKAMARIAPIAFTLAACTPDAAWADPVHITVHFTLKGDHEAGGTSPADPDNGRSIASGSFSIVATPPAGGGQLEDFTRGLHTDSVSLTWAGTSWTPTTADVGRLIFDPRGVLVYWQLSGVPAGLANIIAGTAPDIYIDPFAFLYTSDPSNLYEGAVLSAAVTVTPAGAPPPDPGQVPEPATVALVAFGVGALAARRGRTRGLCSAAVSLPH